MNPGIAIVGLACCYPDARTPAELWENVLAQRRAFRRIPAERVRLADYFSPDRAVPDHTYATQAALIEGYEFDRVAHRVVGSTFRAADLTHWLALDIAGRALADAGFTADDGLPRESTAVVLGNTLTGEFSRANVMRLRWPYVRRVVRAALLEEGRDKAETDRFLTRLEETYKRPFPPVGEETLAGALSNTIAGRICNHFDLRGGGYTVDGACASSLLAICIGCSSLAACEADVVIAGGVDLSIDPFELVGFAKASALAQSDMRVYDKRSEGFWPGEGCGLVVLMREDDAARRGRDILARISGWGVSSDGAGGITRPEFEGQLLAVRRAYRKAGFGPDTVAYFEGHGTGTRVGDETELRVLNFARRDAGVAERAGIGSVKANIGHTKAAAGAAGLIKAVQALRHQVLPPTTGCQHPHAELQSEDAALRVVPAAELWPANQPLRAGVSAMGFGGINTHIVLESPSVRRRTVLTEEQERLSRTPQDSELLLFDADDKHALAQSIERLVPIAERISHAELSDLASALHGKVRNRTWRAAIIADTPHQLADRLRLLGSWMSEGVRDRLDGHAGVFVGAPRTRPRIGVLFPGQGSTPSLTGGLWRRRFEDVDDVYRLAGLPTEGDVVGTALAQPAIIAGSLAALRTLDRLGVRMSTAIGHSLGELAAYRWAGVFSDATLLSVARLRGAVMARLGSANGAMANIAASADVVARHLGDANVVIANLNAPNQTVISGEIGCVMKVTQRAEQHGVRAVRLPVSHAFHSPLMAASGPSLAQRLAGERFAAPARGVFSTITGHAITAADDLRGLLVRQVTSPVRFTEALAQADRETDLWIEAGPGRVLTGLLQQSTDTPVFPTDAGSETLTPLLAALGALFARGAPLELDRLFSDRFTRSFDLAYEPRFFANPCELVPGDEVTSGSACAGHTVCSEAFENQADSRKGDAQTARDVVRRLVVDRTELPPESIDDDDKLLDDLHLNSISIGQIVTSAARALGIAPPSSPLDYARATVRQVAHALEELRSNVTDDRQDTWLTGVDGWVRPFTVDWEDCPQPTRARAVGPGRWRIVAADQDEPIVEELNAAVRDAPGEGIVAALPTQPGESADRLLLASVQAWRALGEGARFVLLERGAQAAAFVRSLYAENPHASICIAHVGSTNVTAQRVLGEALAVEGFVEVDLRGGTRRERRLHLLELPRDSRGALPLGPEDVLLVTGGGKGITFECALAVAKESGARLALLGRADPATDAALRISLERLSATGLTHLYVRADVTDKRAVARALRGVAVEWGPISALLHGAGRNDPAPIDSLDSKALRRTAGPKVGGLRNVLAALRAEKMRLLITFGSIIAETGMEGNADYALANDRLAHLTQQWGVEHPHCRCLVVEWSVWSGVGMGERLGVIERLRYRGVTPIATEQGVMAFVDLLRHELPAVRVVVTSRFGSPATLKLHTPELPLARFLERIRVYVPGVEIVADSDVNADKDPYVSEHVYRGEPLFPAVVGLEAMAQVASPLLGAPARFVFENVALRRPLVIGSGGETVRIAALRRDLDRVDVVVRSAATGFAVDHFSATCRAATAVDHAALANLSGDTPDDFPGAPLVDAQQELYGDILWQTGRFRRLGGYRELAGQRCDVEILPGQPCSWFGSYLPQTLSLGDPAARDAAIHAIQACIPHASILPIRVDRITVGTLGLGKPARLFARGVERERIGDEFVYDLAIYDECGRVRETWSGLRLKRIDSVAPPDNWPYALLRPYLERRLGDVVPGSDLSIVVTTGDASSQQVMQAAISEDLILTRRGDGKPIAIGAQSVTAAHAGAVTMAVAGAGTIGCDIEPVAHRTRAEWSDLLGRRQMLLAGEIERQAGEGFDTTATRIWSALECLRKADVSEDVPLSLVTVEQDGCIVLSVGEASIATFAVSLRDVASPIVLAVYHGDANASI